MINVLLCINNILLWIWQLPQHVLGLFIILVTRANREQSVINYWSAPKKVAYWGVSLGTYIIFSGYYPSSVTLRHEHGHQIQSKYLGPLYLLIIGLPSITFNIIDRLFHKKWNYAERQRWYYSLPWEAWADKLGGVQRSYVSAL